MPKKYTLKEAASILAKRGASKGGKARAAALSPERRKEIARLAVGTRWKRFLLIPGRIASKSDGESHDVTARQLAELYRVPMTECLVMDQGDWRGYTEDFLSSLIRLEPRYDGDYSQFWL